MLELQRYRLQHGEAASGGGGGSAGRQAGDGGALAAQELDPGVMMRFFDDV